MADQVGTGPANGQQQQQQQQGTGILGMIVRGVAFYYLFTTIFKGSTTGPAPVPAPSPGEAGEGGEAVAPAVTSGYHSNLFLKNDEMVQRCGHPSLFVLVLTFWQYLEVYMSEKAYIDPLKEKDKLIWREDGLTYTSSDENNREMQTVIEPTEVGKQKLVWRLWCLKWRDSLAPLQQRIYVPAHLSYSRRKEVGRFGV